MNQLLDVLIIGGGPAGLNAALVLGRARKNVVVIDDETPRNWVTRESHGFVTRDGASPREFRKAAKEQIAAYPSVQFASDTATAITGNDGDFVIKTTQGASYRTRKILFAVGKKDLPLDINGLTEVYGKSAFVCPYCDGWELRDQSLVIIVSGDKALHMAKVISGWTTQYTICTNGSDSLTDEQREELKRHNVTVFDAPIQSINSEEGMVQQVVLNDGIAIPCTGVFFQPKLFTGSELPKAIGCEITESGTVIVDASGKTSVAGVYSAGDAASEMYQAITAASLGALSAVSINNELNFEKWDEPTHR
ncbi:MULTISPECIES: NAD(P)/FAD-dependent oxidoreductase [unclassified Paenibacillus]|uniref:NAD(P)/FAD-dependent oxidoreductase n=1 Tax=unclassified Paenibacillus TaxID=185978 RepID=UPI000CFB6EDB|nr:MULTISPECIES: NAD(P)/FAD-dependent oxidoreductase [unclassified Paenibacillus]PRA08083.1 pyridine nucleotide-disulfide oxidoreductase [Paenibacillus sp. MYb63]PRA51535.1 pyridine nucleotide-disulfide oxidoreductase [Paenibacillus sp. MYb67]QZN78881.1 NAD(P)/FAD-dependent oxidoreductase [Paenibacillus sp. DR312]